MKLAGKVKQWIMNQSLTRKLLFSYLFVLIMPMLLFGGYAIQSSRDYVVDKMDTALSSMVERAEKLMEVKRIQLENMLLLCADNEELQEAYANQYSDRYEQHVGIARQMYNFYANMLSYYYGDIDNLHFYSNQTRGKYTMCLSGMDVAEQKSWYQQVQAYQKTGAVHWCISDGDIFAVIWVYKDGIVSPKYQPLGMIYCSLDMKSFINQYTGLDWDSYRMEIIDEKGDVLFEHSTGNAAVGSDYVEYGFRSSIGWQFRYYVRYDIGKQIAKLLNTHRLVILLSAAGMILFILILTYTLLKRLHRLKNCMEDVQGGNLSVEIYSEAQDEIGRLTNAFSVMLKRLRTMVEERVAAERQIGELELQILRAQIDPHFLDNTLSYINWHALRSGDHEISNIVIQLATFYRTCLNEGYGTITVEREMDNVRAYIEIQAMLHDYSFDASFNVQPEASEKQMLCFLLQPLVENAIRHGVDCKQDGRGTVEVSAWIEGDRLILEVSDDGPGIDVQTPDKPKTSLSKGYGIGNVISRIRLIYGDEYGLVFEKNEPSGLRVKVILPANMK